MVEEKRWNVIAMYGRFKICWQMEKNLFETRYETSLRGTMIPRGAKIFYQPISTKKASSCGYPLNAGGGWTGDPHEVDAEDFFF